MAMLCDPDINMIQLTGRDTPEPSIRAMIYHYYDSMGMGSQKSRSFTDEYIKIQNEICQKSIASGKE